MTTDRPPLPDCWRPMTPDDLPDVLAVAAAVHPAYPEDAAVFEERLRLHPQGCLVLDAGGRIVGYGVGHPWDGGAPPGLNTLLGDLPASPSIYYIHDIALLPEARGAGGGAAAVERFVALARAEGFRSLSLIAVSGTEAFWSGQGFARVMAPALAEKLRSYDADARLMRRVLG